jgi:MFS family permease
MQQNSFSSSKLSVFFTLMLCPFLMGVDFLGIGVALPYITRYFSLHDSTTHWMITLFAIGYVSFVVTSSRLADLYGRRRLFVWSVLLFALSSLLVAMAFNFIMVLVGRLLQGISAGAMIMVVIALISSIFTGEQRKNYTSTLVAMFGLVQALAHYSAGY